MRPQDVEIEVIPADGRDYCSGNKAREDWNSGVEFVNQTRGFPSKITRFQAKELGVQRVMIRYDRTTEYARYCLLRAPTDLWE